MVVTAIILTMTHMNHWDGVHRWFERRITSGFLERFNSLLRSAKVCGYCFHKSFINMAYLILGTLDPRQQGL